MYFHLYSELDEIEADLKSYTGKLKLDHFIELYKIISKHTQKQFNPIKQEFIMKRRECLNKGDDDQYRYIVKQSIWKQY